MERGPGRRRHPEALAGGWFGKGHGVNPYRQENQCPGGCGHGIGDAVVPKGKVLQRRLELAEMISQFPQGAIRTDKEAVLRGIGEPLTAGLRIEAMLFNTLIGTHDFSEEPGAFGEKRKAKWKND